MLKLLGVGVVKWHDAWKTLNEVPYQAVVSGEAYKRAVLQTNYGVIFIDEEVKLVVVIHNFIEHDNEVSCEFTVVPYCLVETIEIYEEVNNNAD